MNLERLANIQIYKSGKVCELIKIRIGLLRQTHTNRKVRKVTKIGDIWTKASESEKAD